MAGIYVHLPFCASFCRYCSFYSERCADRTTMARYIEALSREISQRKRFFVEAGASRPTTLYLGGGTPSLLPDDLLERLVGELRQAFWLGQRPSGARAARTFSSERSETSEAWAEFTLEANPDDITPERLEAWRRLGVNRLSIGVQSFHDAHLRWMCRRHTASQAKNGVRMAQEAGFDNISLDLIFGYTGLTDEEWLEDIDRAFSLKPTHLSCYQMSIEEGSTLGDEAAAGAYAPPAQETCARQYALLAQRAAAAGFRHYEISNFTLPGKEARHNSAYWRREPYLGFGPGAHSYDGLRTRRWNRSDLEAYLAGKDLSESETLSDKDLANEEVMLALRTEEGLDLKQLSADHRAALNPILDRLLTAGLLVVKQAANRVRIPESKWFISDSIISELFL